MKFLKLATATIVVLMLSACDFLSPSVESMGEEIVKQYQKSPNSFKSEFSEIIWKGREKGGKDVYVVRVSYDSQNSFGAMLRGCAFVAFTVVGREYQWRRETGFQGGADTGFCMKSLSEPARQALAEVGRAFAAMSFDLVTNNQTTADLGNSPSAKDRNPPTEFCDSCEGVWNIYASIPNGQRWWRDKTGEDAEAKRINASAVRIIEELSECGITARAALSDWFDTFTPNLVVVHSIAFADAKRAASQLSLAKSCGIAGYSKAGFLQVAGND